MDDLHLAKSIRLSVVVLSTWFIALTAVAAATVDNNLCPDLTGSWECSGRGTQLQSKPDSFQQYWSATFDKTGKLITGYSEAIDITGLRRTTIAADSAWHEVAGKEVVSLPIISTWAYYSCKNATVLNQEFEIYRYATAEDRARNRYMDMPINKQTSFVVVDPNHYVTVRGSHIDTCTRVNTPNLALTEK